jgi:hypothetical protein
VKSHRADEALEQAREGLSASRFSFALLRLSSNSPSDNLLPGAFFAKKRGRCQHPPLDVAIACSLRFQNYLCRTHPRHCAGVLSYGILSNTKSSEYRFLKGFVVLFILIFHGPNVCRRLPAAPYELSEEELSTSSRNHLSTPQQ